MKEILREAKFLISLATFICFDSSDPADRIARVLEEKSGVYHVDIIPPWFSMLIYITWGINNRPAGGSSSETYSLIPST
jgi:hypothetical protein